MLKKNRHNLNKGFSLIDLAAALTVSALLIGATLKGQWLFNIEKENSVPAQSVLSNLDFSLEDTMGKSINVKSGTGDTTPHTIFDGRGIELDANIIVCSRGVPGDLVISLDKRLDDGNPAMGKMLAKPDVETVTKDEANAITDIKANKQYIVCLGI